MAIRDLRTLAILLAVASPLLPRAAGAQTERAAAPEQIIVTANKRAQPIQEVPAAVAALSAADLAAAGVENIVDVARQIPALEALTATSPAQTTFRLRRVGNLGNISTFEPAVGIFVDGAYRLSSIFAVNELFGIERIEVLRGPQTALYGKNTAAGLVAIYTEAPGSELGADVQLTVGNVEGAADATRVHFKGEFSAPLADTLSAGLGLSMLDEQPTWTSALAHGGEDANDLDRVSVRGQLQWDMSDSLDFRLILATIREDDRQISEDVSYDPTGFVSTMILPTLQAAGVSDRCTDNDAHNRRHCLRTAWRADIEGYDATLLTNYDFANGWTLSAVTSWDEYELKGTNNDPAQIAAPVLRYQNTLASESLQQDVRVTSAPSTSFDWLAGLFYFDNEHKRGDSGNRPLWLYDEASDNPAVSALHQTLFNVPEPLPFATQGQIGTLDAGQDTRYVSVYGHTTWRPAPKVAINTGLRWQEEDKDAHVIQSANDPSPSVLSLLLVPAAVSTRGLHRSTSELTWSVSPQWFVTDTTMLFATAAHGFKSGGFNVASGRLPLAEREFLDEDIEHFEIGVKSDLWDGRMRLAASAFRTDYNDYQDAAFVGTQFTVGNAEKLELDGVELEGTVALTQRLALELAASYADVVYASHTHGACHPGLVPNIRTNPGVCDLSGQHPMNAPRLKTHLALSYEKSAGWADLSARLDWSTTSEYSTTYSLDPNRRQPAYDWINLRLAARWDRFELVVWTDNLTDETVANLEGPLNIYAGDHSYQSQLQRPRSVGMTFRAYFP